MTSQLARAIHLASNWTLSDLGSLLIFPAVAMLFLAALALIP